MSSPVGLFSIGSFSLFILTKFSSSFSIFRSFYLYFDFPFLPLNRRHSPTWKWLTYSWHKSRQNNKNEKNEMITYVIMKFNQLIKSKHVFARDPSFSLIFFWLDIHLDYNLVVIKIFDFSLKHFSDHFLSSFSWNITNLHNMSLICLLLF